MEKKENYDVIQTMLNRVQNGDLRLNFVDGEIVGKRIRDKREQSGLTQNQLAILCGISDSEIGFIENGKRLPSVEVLVAVSAVFGKSEEYFLHAGGEFEKNISGGNVISEKMNQLDPEEREKLLQQFEALAEVAVRQHGTKYKYELKNKGKI